ncbi:dihydrofolate reductase [Kribbella sp. VKM Ac-2571]|uniref:dihydrofolate reductase family protein n=1 Tax=Kribbella sp. VKM Ac-2571 TaxID=2512222 RepID=UPI0010ECAD9C|nr:dihydrofolate reductase family protein [Kribbella sp. VKM Ac-2571]TDO56803.1 dihydrofolate reductase [Kribbella sp. VKM Ac-2571]
MTGTVIWHMTMSLDGFIGDRDDSVDWMSAADGGPSGLGDEVIATCGAFLCGGKRVEAVGENRPYGGVWQGPILIYTHKDPATNPIPEFTYVSGDIRDVVAQGLEAAAGKNLVVTGGTVPRLAVEAGLVDELVLHIIPILLGEGVRFYDSPGVHPTKLKLLSAENLNYRFEVLR